MKGINPHDEIKGSNPTRSILSTGGIMVLNQAHFGELSDRIPKAIPLINQIERSF
jgi:hypothetical protein